MPTSYAIGQLSETTAAAYLQKNGLTLTTKNFRCPRGEIDLIMQDQDYLVFVEVRFRQNQHYGNSIDTISPHKQARLTRTALYYLQQHALLDKVNCRFDVLGLDTDGKITWIRNAFEVKY